MLAANDKKTMIKNISKVDAIVLLDPNVADLFKTNESRMPIEYPNALDGIIPRPATWFAAMITAKPTTVFRAPTPVNLRNCREMELGCREAVMLSGSLSVAEILSAERQPAKGWL